MPFTFSHPALILPLTYFPGRWFSLTGLIVGSLIPDFEYFLRMKTMSNYSHTIDGLFWFDLPMGLLLTFLFHNLVRNHLFENLPLFLKSRFSIFMHFSWNEYFKKNWFVVIISILIGAVSHIFWDGFTHSHGYFVELIPTLRNTSEILGKQVPIFKILQHSSTFIGGLVIAFSIYKLPRGKNVNEIINFRYWMVLVGVTFAIVVVRLLSGLHIEEYGNIIVTTISSILISLIITPWLIKWRS